MSLPRRFAAALTAAVLLPLTVALPAQAYPDPVISVTGNGSAERVTVVGGEPIAVHAESGGVDCDWTAELPGGSAAPGSGTTYDTSVSTPEVDDDTDTSISVTCTYDEVTDGLGTAGSSDVQAAATAGGSIAVTLLPAGVAGVEEEDDGSGVAGVEGLLPDTGGQSFWILLGGALLVVVGGGALVVARRRAS